MSERNITNFPKNYEDAAVIAGLAAEELMGRLTFMTIKPKVVLDLGCGTGLLTKKLKEYYKDANVIGIDSDETMISYATKENHGLTFFCADALSLPFPSSSVDMIVANFLMPWLPDAGLFLDECKRVLRPQGLLLFTTLGSDSLSMIEHDLRVDDMHDLGDAMLRMGLIDAVLDANQYTLSYRDASKMMLELTWSQFIPSSLNYSKQEVYDINFEVIFAHAFTDDKSDSVTKEQGETRIPISVLRHQLRRG